MNKNARSIMVGSALTLILTANLLGVDSQLRTLTTTTSSPEIPSDVAQKFKLQGVVFENGKPFASIGDNSTKRQVWVNVNDEFSGFVVMEIKLNQITLQKRGTENETVLQFAVGASKLTNADAPQPYTKAWINSNANPMLRQMQQLPIDIYNSWATLSSEEKKGIIEFYAKHGWRLILAETIGATTNLAWENIYEKERREVVKANRTAFVESLSPNQKSNWEKIGSNPAIRITNGEPSEEQLKIAAERRQAFEQFKSTLQPTQKEKFDSISDFTKGTWK